jgi:hypothetical protein
MFFLGYGDFLNVLFWKTVADATFAKVGQTI